MKNECKEVSAKLNPLTSGVARPSLMVGHIFLSMISYWHAGSYVHLLKKYYLHEKCTS